MAHNPQLNNRKLSRYERIKIAYAQTVIRLAAIYQTQISKEEGN